MEPCTLLHVSKLSHSAPQRHGKSLCMLPDHLPVPFLRTSALSHRNASQAVLLSTSTHSTRENFTFGITENPPQFSSLVAHAPPVWCHHAGLLQVLLRACWGAVARVLGIALCSEHGSVTVERCTIRNTSKHASICIFSSSSFQLNAHTRILHAAKYM